MSLENLNNLVKSGQLKKEPFNEMEFLNLVRSGEKRLRDANNPSLASESCFDLAYNAAHALAFSALRWHGYRAENRYIVFQVLPITVGVGPEVWRILAKCHDRRNLAEYEGHTEVEDQLLLDLLNAAKKLLDSIKQKIDIKILGS